MVTMTCDVQCHDDSDYVVDNAEVDSSTEYVREGVLYDKQIVLTLLSRGLLLLERE